MAHVRVILADAKGRHSDSTSTDSSGTFYLTAPKPGEYALRFAQRQLWFDNSPSFRVQAEQCHQGSYLIPDHSPDRVSTADGVEQPAIPMAGNPAPR